MVSAVTNTVNPSQSDTRNWKILLSDSIFFTQDNIFFPTEILIRVIQSGRNKNPSILKNIENPFHPDTQLSWKNMMLKRNKCHKKSHASQRGENDIFSSGKKYWYHL